MIRIAYIVDSFGLGGLERCVARLVSELDPQRFEPLVICLRTSGAATQWIRRSNVEIVEIHRSAGTDWRAMRRLGHELSRREVDIVHSHNWATLLETAVARRWAKVPVHVHAQRGMFFHAGTSFLKTQARRMATRWAVGRAQCLLLVDDSVKGYWEQRYGMPRTRVEVIVNGVEVPTHDASGQAARELRVSLGLSESDVVVGSVGRLVPVKSFETLIDAAAQLHREGNPVHVVLVGEGEQRGRLEQIRESHGMSRFVHLAGEQQNVGDWLKAMQIYVNCSLSEGMSQSVLEAMSLGLPLAVTDVGANRSLVEGPGACGLVVPAGDANELAAAIGRLVASPQLRDELSQASLARHQSRYTVDEMIRRYEGLYEELFAACPQGNAVGKMRAVAPAATVGSR